MNSSVYLITALLACISSMCSAQVKCYKCSYRGSNPKDSDCWKDVAAAADTTEVDCNSYCYSETFQSGGPALDENYWFINRGCADSDGEVCADSDNCKNEAWGTCKKCCSEEKCNTDSPSGSDVVKASLVVALFAAVLAKCLN